MGSADLPPLSSALRALVEAERSDVVPDPARAASVLAAVEDVVALGAISQVAASGVGPAGAGGKAAETVVAAGKEGGAELAKSALSLSLGKVIGIAAVALAAGVGAGIGIDRTLLASPYAHESSPTTRAPTSSGTPPTEEAVPFVGAPSASAMVPALAEPRNIAPFATSSGTPSATSSAPQAGASVVPSRSGLGALAQEQAIIDAARAGLASKQYEDVLVAADRHARSFPSGQLSEERDAMRILALARLGRAPEARTRAEQFKRTYPASALLPKVQSAVE